MDKKINFGRVKVVSWDIDGTMYDLEKLIRAFKRDLFSRMLSRHWIRAWIDFFRLLGFKRFMDRIRAKAGDFRVGVVPKRDAVAQTQDEMYGRILPGIGIEPGVKELMVWLNDQGIEQVVFSDYLPSTKLKALGVEGVFSTIYAGETLGYLKPGTDSFEAIIRAHDLEPDELLHIGDRIDTDGAAADQVGYQVAIIGAQFESAGALQAALASIQDTSPESS